MRECHGVFCMRNFDMYSIAEPLRLRYSSLILQYSRLGRSSRYYTGCLAGSLTVMVNTHIILLISFLFATTIEPTFSLVRDVVQQWRAFAAAFSMVMSISRALLALVLTLSLFCYVQLGQASNCTLPNWEWVHFYEGRGSWWG